MVLCSTCSMLLHKEQRRQSRKCRQRHPQEYRSLSEILLEWMQQGSQTTTLIIHNMYYTQHLLYTICIIHNTYYTQYVLYTTLIIHNMYYTQHLLYTICIIHNTYYTQYVLYTICIIHNMYYAVNINMLVLGVQRISWHDTVLLFAYVWLAILSLFLFSRVCFCLIISLSVISVYPFSVLV